MAAAAAEGPLLIVLFERRKKEVTRDKAMDVEKHN